VQNREDFVNSLSVALAPWTLYYAAVDKTMYNFTHSPNADSFIKNFEESLNSMLDLTSSYWSHVMNVVNGKNGANGYNGVETIKSVNLSITGSGYLEIVGGNGANGCDGTKPIYGNTRGGDGGNSGSAIYCKTYINLMEKGSYNITSGTPGEGGAGNKGIGQSQALKGKKGKSPKSIQAIFEFSK
jgi:hypothetical protein